MTPSLGGWGAVTFEEGLRFGLTTTRKKSFKAVEPPLKSENS